MVIKVPCYNCERRHAKCHSECKDYADYKRDFEELKRLNAQSGNNDYLNYRIQSMMKGIKKKNEKNRT